MAPVVQRYKRYAKRRRRRALAVGQRLDIQGLRMVAVLTVFANHLWGWPRGGFVGVDVFFVISGFLITSNLLNMAERRGNISFAQFYWNRIRRIVPAATAVLIGTVIASYAVFLQFRAREVGIDAIWAFFFASNWWFGYQGTDYFRAAAETVSPLQHFWSLSIEEQFYFVWPAIISVTSVYVLRRGFTLRHRMQIAGCIMAGIIFLSLSWALYQTLADAAWAYFDTFSRVWELGVGALLATAVGSLAKVPIQLKPILSWTGLLLIGASLILISEDSLGFPAPWALVPILGASLVIGAGVGGEPRSLAVLQNPVSGYIGNISYSLYLVHWPTIIILGSLMEATASYYASALTLGFGLAIASYHFVENPLRRADYAKARKLIRDIRKRRYNPQPASGYAAAAALTLIAVAAVAYVARPEASSVAVPPATTASSLDQVESAIPQTQLGPLATVLRGEIDEALQATEWPPLDPPMESVLEGGTYDAGISACTKDEAVPDPNKCIYGDEGAPTKLVLVGDSVSLGYAGPLRNIVRDSGGRMQLHILAMGSCTFVNDLIDRPGLRSQCVARKQYAVDLINDIKPTAVIIANWYQSSRVVGSSGFLTPRAWGDSMRAIVDTFRSNVGTVVLLSPPPGDDLDIKACYSNRSSEPPDCIGTVTRTWESLASVEQRVAESVGGKWIDSRAWFCNAGRLCPAFVGDKVTKVDSSHMAPPFGDKITPVIEESLRGSGVL